jgi:hypothetical protein
VQPRRGQCWLEVRSDDSSLHPFRLLSSTLFGVADPFVISFSHLRLVIPLGIQECPTSGRLWALQIWNEPRPQRKTRAADALKRTNDDPIIIAVIARLFWSERKIEKARQWFGRAVDAGKDVGDNWGWWYRFELEHGEPVSPSLLSFSFCVCLSSLSKPE